MATGDGYCACQPGTCPPSHAQRQVRHRPCRPVLHSIDWLRLLSFLKPMMRPSFIRPSHYPLLRPSTCGLPSLLTHSPHALSLSRTQVGVQDARGGDPLQPHQPGRTRRGRARGRHTGRHSTTRHQRYVIHRAFQNATLIKKGNHGNAAEGAQGVEELVMHQLAVVMKSLDCSMLSSNTAGLRFQNLLLSCGRDDAAAGPQSVGRPGSRDPTALTGPQHLPKGGQLLRNMLAPHGSI
jgi:hypothetical protein